MATKGDLQYGIDDVPPWYLTILLAFQHYLTMFGATIAIPLVITPLICLGNDEVSRSEIIGTTFFVSGLVTLIQTTVGVRLPIVQGGTFALVSPIIAIMSLPHWKCPAPTDSTLAMPNDTLGGVANTTSGGLNATAISILAEDARETWQVRMREIQGAIILSACAQALVGLTGLMGPMLRFIGPLTIAPTITLIGLSLFGSATGFCEKQWGIAFLTMILIILFSQYLRNVDIPCCKVQSGSGCVRKDAPIFKLFPVILAIGLSWGICWVLTVAGALPDSPDAAGYGARTDTKQDVLQKAKWFRMPYPCQWGMPTFNAASALGMFAGILAGMIESIGDYYACARLAGAPQPPVHAINRGVFVEGLGCIIAGLYGTGTGTTSYSENIGAIGITKVGSRRVMQVGGIIMLTLGMLGKFGALFVTIPDPVVGGVFMVMFGMISAVGVSNLQFVDLNSSRNLFIFGFALFAGLAIPFWLANNTGIINTGVAVIDQIITVLCTTSMFVGGFLGFVLDNTIPGTPTERGMDAWTDNMGASTLDMTDQRRLSQCSMPFGMKVLHRQESHGDGSYSSSQEGRSPSLHSSTVVPLPQKDPGTYDCPLGMRFIRKWKWMSYIPICPTYTGCPCGRRHPAPKHTRGQSVLARLPEDPELNGNL